MREKERMRSENKGKDEKWEKKGWKVGEKERKLSKRKGKNEKWE